MNSNQISIKPVTIIRVLGILTFFLVLASVGGQLVIYVFGHDIVKGNVILLVRAFQLNNEHNIPTLFTVMLLAFAAMLLWIITILCKKNKVPYIVNWAVLSVGFLYMAFDEALQIHERFVGVGRTLLGDGKLGIFYNSWVIVYIPIIILIALFFMKLLLHLPGKTRTNFIVAATIYLGGCIGVEMIGGAYAEIHGHGNLMYNLIANVEDTLEMAGLIVFIWALLTYIANTYKKVLFQFDGFLEKSRSEVTKY